MPKTLSEIEALIAGVARKDHAAFLELYDAISAKLMGVTLRILKDRADAEDSLQEVFVKVWKHADRYAANGLSPMTWLITIARNTAIDRLRSRRIMDGDDAVAAAVDPAAGPEEEAILHSEARSIARCLSQLPEDRAAAIRGAYLEGQSYADLAARYDVPLNTMRTWLRRGLIKLRECLDR